MAIPTETRVAMIPTTGPIISNEEQDLKAETTAIQEQFNDFYVATQDDYTAAAEYLKQLKGKIAQVTDFFKPLKDAAHKAHKQVLAREKEMLSPLTDAEERVKAAMGRYSDEVEQKALEQERIRAAEIKKQTEALLQTATELEKQGKTGEAVLAFEEAEIMDSTSSAMAINDTPKVSGVSTKKDWEIIEIDMDKVPDEINGILIRPVDQKAVMRLIRASKGAVKIPGITYKETSKISVRRS